MRIKATPNTDIIHGGSLLWEIEWQRPDQDKFSQLISMPPQGWSDPGLKDVLPEDVADALVFKYVYNQ